MVGRHFSHSFRRAASALRRIIPALLVLGLCALGRPAGAQSTGTAPDLVAENVSFTPAAVTLGTIVTPIKDKLGNVISYTYNQDRITLQVTIRNKGNKASMPMVARVWASPDATVDGTGNDVMIYSFLVPALAPGATDDHLTANKTDLKIDPNFVGMYQNLFLQPGTYTLGVQVDANDENPGELDEHNFFVAAGTLTVAAKQSTDPNFFLPANGTDIASVSRPVEWTSSSFANRYNLYFGKLKDLTQRFLPQWLPDPGPDAYKIWVTDLGGPAEGSAGYWYQNWDLQDLNLRDVNPDILVMQQSKLVLYMNKNLANPFNSANPHYRDPVKAQFFPPITLLQTTTSPLTRYVSYGSVKYGDGSISSAIPVNIDYYYNNVTKNNYELRNAFMDVVVGEYMYTGNNVDDPLYFHEGKYYSGHRRAEEGQVFVVLNVTSPTLYGYPRTFSGLDYPLAPPSRPELLYTKIIPLPNNRRWNNEPDIHPLGIKSVAVADLDNDSDVDIIAGSDRIWNGVISDKVVAYQNTYQNNAEDPDPNEKNPNIGGSGGWQDKPSFKPVAITSDADNLKIEDAHDLAVGDFDKDGRMDIALASFHGHCVWILHNETDTGGDKRTTRTLSFSSIGPLQAFDANMTTVPLYGASTICSCDLNNDHKADLIAGGYIQGQIVVYENRSTYSGDTMKPDFIPHMLTYDQMLNVEKVVGADINGDGLMDVVCSSATNDKLVWFENLGNFNFTMHVATDSDKANHVGYIAVADMNNDMLPDIVSLSPYSDAANPAMRLWTNNAVLTGKNLVASNLLHPTFDPSKALPAGRMEFNTTYGWQVVSKAGDSYSITSPAQFFHTQPTRVKLWPSLGAFSQIEPGSGAYIKFDYNVDGPQDAYAFGVDLYCDPVLDRGYTYYNGAYFDGVNTFYPWLFGFYDFHRMLPRGSSSLFGAPPLTAAFDASTVPEGVYNFWVEALGRTPTNVDGIRDGVLDGVGDGFDNIPRYRMDQFFTNGTWGDDVYLARERMAVALKPGMPQNPAPFDGATNVPTGTKLSWSTTNYTTGYDVSIAKASNAMPTYTSVTVSLAAPLATSIATGDIDNDGQIDLATSYYTGNNGHVAWFKNLSLGRGFRAYDIAADLNGPADVSIANLDSDTRPDILAASPFDGKILWYRNLGVGTGTIPIFGTASVISSQAASVNTARPVDLNRDGKIDVVAAMSGPKRLCWYENTGTGWAEHPIDTVNGLPMYAIPADVNGDGLMDLVVASWSPYSVAWYENRGGLNPTFVRHLVDNTVQSPKWLAVGDINNDGGLDIVTVSNDTVSGSITWFESDRSFPPNFTPHTVASGVRGLHNLAVTDYNHDARPDIITALDNGNQILFYANSGGSPLTFTPFTINRQAAPVSALAAADLDGDTFQEVLDGNTAGGMYWFDFVTNFQYLGPLAKINPQMLTPSSLGLSGSTWTWSSLPAKLEPSQGYKWQVTAKRQIPIYGGTYERVTSSTVWGFQTSQCDLAATKLDLSTRAVPQGDHFTVTVYEDNVGLSDAAPHVTEVWASPDQNFTRGSTDIYLGSINMPGIAAGGRATGKLDVNTAATGWQRNLTMAMGYYYIGYFVNTTGAENSESRQDNNFNYNGGRLQILHGNAAESWRGYR